MSFCAKIIGAKLLAVFTRCVPYRPVQRLDQTSDRPSMPVKRAGESCKAFKWRKTGYKIAMQTVSYQCSSLCAWRCAINVRPNTQPVVEVHYYHAGLLFKRWPWRCIATTCHPACLLFAAFSAKLPARDRVNSFGPTLDGGAHYRLQRWAGAAPVEVHYYHACLSACLLIFSGCHLCTFCCRRLFAKTFFSLRGSNSGEA